VKAGVIGSPITHSLSPAVHRAAYEFLGLDWTYEAHDVSARGVAQFVNGLDSSWRGLSVTMPCKEAIVELGEPDEVVASLGVGNTMVFESMPGNPTTTHIHNTDVTGFEMLLGGVLDKDPSLSVEVFGTGATARSALYALGHLGVDQVHLRARDDHKRDQVADQAQGWGVKVLGPHDNPQVVISTIPSQIARNWIESTDPQVVFDVAYDPWPTPLAAWASSHGARCISGLDLLAAQGVGQIRHMTGQSISFDILRRALDQ